MGNGIGIHFRGYPHVSLEVELTTMADAVKHKEKFNLFFFIFKYLSFLFCIRKLKANRTD